MKLLVVDDEKNILTLLKVVLEKEKFTVITAENGKEALDLFITQSPDFIICDEMMPFLSGNELVKEIRKSDNNIPILMVTARTDIKDKGKSFALGVDDYMTKPIDTDELIMRVYALSRRAKIFADHKIVIGTVTLDEETHTISDGEERNLTLTKLEFELLYKLLSYPEKAFTKWQLFDEFWGVESDTDEAIVKVMIFKIRKQIALFPEIGIKTLMGVGYQGVRNEK